MASPRRLVTTLRLDDAAADRFSVSARHELELDDGSRVLLLDDRGWTSSGPADIWAHTTAAGVVETARAVVGPDEPHAGQTAADGAAQHWAYLAQIAYRQGAPVTPDELSRLRHDVVLPVALSDRLGDR